MTDGGTDGGRLLCNGGCTDVWAACIDDGDAGVCEPGVLSVTAPTEGSSYRAGAMVPASATLTLASGGAWPVAVSIPVARTWGADSTIVSGVAGTLSGAPDAGSYRVTFGWDAGPGIIERSVSFTSCESARCQPWQRCVPTVTGGSCVNLQMSLRWTVPSDGFTRGPLMANMPVEVVLDTDAGVATLPLAVPVTFDGGTWVLMQSATTATTATYGAPDIMLNAALVGTMDGPKTFVAGWQGSGVAAYSAAKSVTWDTTPPQVTLAPTQRPASLPVADPVASTSWVKDEVANVTLTVAGAVATPTTSSVTVMGFNPMTSVVPAANCAATCVAPCVCLGLDLKDAPLAGLRGTVRVTVPPGAFVDLVGNQSVAHTVDLQVTRMKWTRDITLNDASNPIFPVAISRSGTVVVAVGNAAGSNPRVLAVAQDGGTLWGALTSGTVTAGPMVGAASPGGDVWVATQVVGPTSQLQKIALANGMAAVPAECISGGLAFSGDLALSSLNAGVTEIPLGIRNGEVLGPAMNGCRSNPVPDLPVAASARSSLVVQNPTSSLTDVYIASTNRPQLWKQQLAGTVWSLQGDAGLPSGTQARGLFFVGTGRVGGGGVSGNGVLFSTAAGVPLSPSTQFDSVPAANSGAPAAGDGFFVWGTSSAEVARVSADAGVPLGAVTTVPVPGSISLQDRTPLLGEGGLVYLVGDNGSLSVRLQSTLAEQWSGSLATSVDAISQPALDVYRGTTGAKQCSPRLGVLYVLTKTGSIATLRAVLVDSKGLDGTAPWPKYQRDNSNTGNVSLPLSAWVCP